MVAMVNNASGIRKAFLKEFINGIIAVQTNVMLHTLEPCSSHVENLRSVWSWSAEMFEAHIHRQTDRQTDRQIPCFYREMTLLLSSYRNMNPMHSVNVFTCGQTELSQRPVSSTFTFLFIISQTCLLQVLFLYLTCLFEDVFIFLCNILKHDTVTSPLWHPCHPHTNTLKVFFLQWLMGSASVQ